MTKRLTVLIGTLHLMTGAVMWIAPAFWYARTPGVVLTGPFNPQSVITLVTDAEGRIGWI